MELGGWQSVSQSLDLMISKTIQVCVLHVTTGLHMYRVSEYNLHYIL